MEKHLTWMLHIWLYVAGFSNQYTILFKPFKLFPFYMYFCLYTVSWNRVWSSYFLFVRWSFYENGMLMLYCRLLYTHAVNTVITLSHCQNILRQHSLEKLLLKYYSITKICFQSLCSLLHHHLSRTWCLYVYLKSFRCRWPIVIPSLITATAYLMLTLVDSLEYVTSSPTAAAHLSLYTL